MNTKPDEHLGIEKAAITAMEATVAITHYAATHELACGIMQIGTDAGNNPLLAIYTSAPELRDNALGTLEAVIAQLNRKRELLVTQAAAGSN